MATDEDNFDIDIYGDGGEDYQQEEQVGAEMTSEVLPETNSSLETHAVGSPDTLTQPPANEIDTEQEMPQEPSYEQNPDVAQKIASTDNSTQDPIRLPKQAPQTQGLKRKDGTDDRLVDSGATTALFISDLHWWVTDDDIRGWANQSQCEDELEGITFSEHKVNGKSKGQAYVVFKSPQASTAMKHKIQSFGEGQQYTKKFTVSFTNPFTNPFHTLPKDGPMRNTNPNHHRPTSSTYGGGTLPQTQMNYNANNINGGYRGNRGGYNNRGGGHAVPNYGRGSYQGQINTGFSSQSIGGFQGAPLGGIPQYGGFQNRGGMMGSVRAGGMGMRGGRGGMAGMMNMPMGGMMGGMASPMGGMSMGMPQMGGAMGMQGQTSFQANPQAHYNPAFFPQQNQQAGGATAEGAWSPHGAKRLRQE